MGRIEQAMSGEMERQPEGFAIAPGVVTNNVDLISEGRVQVRIPSIPGLEPWARLAAVGGGSSRGYLWVPQIRDEVLVALVMNDPASAYILGGLWSSMARPPATITTDFLSKRIIKTGLAGGLGHEVEFDDALQTITITSSTKQKITITPLKIEMANMAGTLRIALSNESQSVSVTAAQKIELTAPQIALSGATIDIKGATVTIQSTGPCSVQGLPIKLN
jgi:uncharacterized protein involved in type VI secretion and phage assembly